MGDIFFIADTHFGHKLMPKTRGFASVEEHDEELIKRWNGVVAKKDMVWVLGDFCFGAKSLEIADRLNGYKKLVMGNHDTLASKRYLQHFNKVYGAVQYHDYIVTHIPVHSGQFPRFKANIHGHLHEAVIDDPRYISVSAEKTGLTPLNFCEIEKTRLIIKKPKKEDSKHFE